MRSTAVLHSRQAISWSGSHLPPLIGVHEMPLDRVAAAKRHIIAALNHAGAAAFADQTLDRQRDLRALLARSAARAARRTDRPRRIPRIRMSVSWRSSVAVMNDPFHCA
jgi:hypothetical protein